MQDGLGREIDYLRISVTDKCNLRCRYCMPPHGITPLAHEEILTLEEIFRLVGIMEQLGIRKVRLTGGEPSEHQPGHAGSGTFSLYHRL